MNWIYGILMQSYTVKRYKENHTFVCTPNTKLEQDICKLIPEQDRALVHISIETWFLEGV